MCGIFGVLNNRQTFNDKLVKTAFDKGSYRGPEDSQLACYSEKLVLGFKRLAINGLNSASSQPMTIGNVTLVCNGEIYNYKELYELMGMTPTTGSDCEVIIRMYKKYGFEYTLEMLDGDLRWFWSTLAIWAGSSDLRGAWSIWGSSALCAWGRPGHDGAWRAYPKP